MMQNSRVFVAALVIAATASLAISAPVKVSQSFVELDGHTEKVEVRGFPAVAEDTARMLGDSENMIDSTATVGLSSEPMVSALSDVQVQAVLNAPPLRRPGRPRKDRLGMDPKRVAKLEKGIESDRKRRERIKRLPEHERKKHTASWYAAAKAWRGSHETHNRTLNAAANARMRLRKMYQSALSSSDTQQPVTSLAADRMHPDSVEALSLSAGSDSIAQASSEAPSSSLFVDANIQRVAKTPRTMLQASRAKVDAVTAHPATPPRTLDATTEMEHKHAALFDQLFGSASPSAAPHATSSEQQRRLFDLNETPPASPTH